MKSRQVYRDLGQAIGRYRAIGINEYDICISGERGEIWEVDGRGTLRAFVARGGKGEELFTFNIKDLDAWVLRIKMGATVAEQLYWANNPNKRLDFPRTAPDTATK